MQKTTAMPAARRAGDPLSARLRRSLQFRYYALFTAVATYGLIVLGGTVRATDSGTACPDWPLCHGQVIPPLESHVLIEFSHRLVASIVGFLILGVAVWAWRRYRANAVIARTSALAMALLVAQVLVGAVTVNTETNGSVVALHLSIALTLLAALILVTVEAFRRVGEAAGTRSTVPLLAVGAGLATFVLIISGAYVSQEGAGLVYQDWPLFDGKLVSAGGKLADLHYLHRLVAAGVGVLLFALVWRTLRDERATVPRVLVVAAFALYAAQVVVGASNIWFELATPVRIAHLALASGLWAVLVFSVAWRYLNQPNGARE